MWTNPNRIDTKHQTAKNEGKNAIVYTAHKKKAYSSKYIPLYMGTLVVFVSQSLCYLLAFVWRTAQANIECGKQHNVLSIPRTVQFFCTICWFVVVFVALNVFVHSFIRFIQSRKRANQQMMKRTNERERARAHTICNVASFSIFSINTGICGVALLSIYTHYKHSIHIIHVHIIASPSSRALHSGSILLFTWLDLIIIVIITKCRVATFPSHHLIFVRSFSFRLVWYFSHTFLFSLLRF